VLISAGVIIASAGVIIASAGEVHFNIIGVFFQISGIMAEALRLVLTQVLLQKKGLSLNPLTS
jgi:drug/metabolite transporter (DMT)-like permease